MQESLLVELVRKIQHLNCEFQTVEVKAAEKGCPTKLRDTLSSFSNQDSGGVIVFGLKEEDDFSIVGVYDAQDLQKKVVEQCEEMQPKVRPLFTVIEIDGKTVVSAEIPSADFTDRPVFYIGSGKYKGSYTRVCEADKLMTDDEIYSFEAFRKRIRDDKRIVDGSKTSMFRPIEITRYLDSVKKDRVNLATIASDDEILELMGVVSEGTPTLAGVMIFSKYPQAHFPQLSITAVVIPGIEMGETGSEGERFIANERFNGTIAEMLEGAVKFVERNMRVKTVIDDDGRRIDKPEFPKKAIREVILNALIHRDYSFHTEGVPITIRMFSDRMEVINKGGIYGRISVDLLGKVNPDTRNPTLANVLEVLRVTENRFSGVPTIRKEMSEAGLPEPIFKSNRGEFTVTLKNNLEESRATITATKKTSVLSNRDQSLLLFCKTPRTRSEIVEHLGLTPYYVYSQVLKPLIDKGLINMTIPEKPKSTKQKFYSK